MPHWTKITLFAATLALLPQSASAYLGSFEESDGYRTPFNGIMTTLNFAGDAKFYLDNNILNGFTGIVPASTFPNTLGDATHGADLSRYNAGQYGANGGGPGGAALDIADNTGLWTAQLGGRLNEDIGGVALNGYQYLGNTSSGNIFLQNRDYVQAYRYGGARNGSQVLNFLAQDTNLRYDYHLDSRDFGGTNPSATNGSIVSMAFWFCPSDADDPDADNILGLGLRDAMGQSVFEVGYTGENIIQYRMTGGGAWISTGTTVGTQGWSEMSLTINTDNDTVTFGVRVYDDLLGLSSTTTGILASQALGIDSAALTDLRWDLRGGALNNGAVSFKNYFDDFSFNAAPVPEPGSALSVGLSTLILLRRRRKSVMA